MTTIIIGPTGITGLSLSPGLTLGTGLVIGFGPFTGIIFQGAGGLTSSTLATEQVADVFAGSGLLSVTTLETIREAATFLGAGSLTAATIQAIKGVTEQFNGAGSLSALVSLALTASETLGGAGSLTGSVTSATAAFAEFDSAGSLSATTRQTDQVSGAFAGTGGLTATFFETIREAAIFAGSGGMSVPLHSLSFVAASSQFLSTTGNPSTNTQKFTIATWFKRSSNAVQGGVYRAENALGSVFYFEVYFSADDRLNIINSNGVSQNVQKISLTTYPDTASWHHLVVAVDTTQATADNRVRLYVDGAEVTSWDTDLNPAQNTNLNNNYAAEYLIGALSGILSGIITGVTNYYNGNFSEFYYIDGQQLTPSSFITDTPGLPKVYSGTYTGVFDFYLNFSNIASTTTLGADGSGEGNNWTLNNMTTANASTDYP